MPNIADVLVPPNEEGTRATVLRWCKEVGDTVVKDEPLVELETDKVTVEIPAPANGTLIEVLKQANAEVIPDEVLARLSLGSESISPQDSAVPAVAGTAAEPPAIGGARDSRQPLSPSVRRLLQEHSIAAGDIDGTGRNGRITAQDVTRYVAEAALRDSAAAHAAAPASTAISAAPAVSAAPAAPTAPAPASRHAGTRIPHSAIRRRVAEHMARSLIEAPHVTTLFEVDLTRVLAHRARYAAEYESRGARLTLTAYFISACVRALRAHPEVNATFHADALELHADINVGVGTALGNKGLIVPVIHRAQGLNLFGMAQRLGRVVEAARAGKLSPEDVRGGTFTVSNHGVGGSLLAAPIVINQPQVAILGVGKVQRRVCAVQVDGVEAISVRSLCYVTLTIDHRALDAFQANAFLNMVVTTLEQWPADET
jgi:2-oxoglutarate dehydrogenase E2 component (dihydrolipoamide succinyltransferase)